MAVFAPFTSDQQVADTARHFLDHTLPRSQWTHSAHFSTTLWLLSTRPRAEVVRDLPDFIRSYNQATGLPNTDLKGYHETITQASLRAAASFFASSQPCSLFAVCNALMRSPLGQPEWLLQYWSRDRLFSADARRQWVEPNLAAFPYP